MCSDTELDPDTERLFQSDHAIIYVILNRLMDGYPYP